MIWRWSLRPEVFLLGFVVLDGCTAAMFGRPEHIPASVPALEVVLPDRAALFDHFSAEDRAKRSYKALVRIHVRAGGSGGGTFQAVMSAQKPDRMRIMGLGPFGGTLFDLGIRRDDFELFIPSSSELWVGRIESLRSLAMMKGLDALQDAWLLAGQIPTGFLRSWDRVALASDNRAILLTMPESGETVWIDPHSLDILREERVDGRGESVRRVALSAYAASESGRYPVQITATGPNGATVQVDVKEWMWNPDLAEEDLSPSVPDDVRRRRVLEAPS